MGEEKQHLKNSLVSLAGKPNLPRLIELISSIIILSHSITVFGAKWKSITAKLDEVTSGLTAVENCDSDENPSFAGLVHAIIDTSNKCYGLARRCVDFSYSGKLLMQSDLDLICAKFDFHLETLSEIITSGVLAKGQAIVVSRPGPGASRDDMRFFMRDLYTRLKIGDVEMKKQTLDAISDILVEDGKYMTMIVEIDGFFSILVKFLDSREIDIQERSSKLVSLIAGFDHCKNFLIDYGVISPLVRVLECKSEVGKEYSARCLYKLTANSENAWSVSANGGVTVLLRICNNCDSRRELIVLACGVLKNISTVEEIKRFMVEEGAISMFIQLVRSKEEAVQISSVDFLQTIASDDESIREIVVREGGIQKLVLVLDPKSSFSSKTREMAFRAVETLCFSSMGNINLLVKLGFLDHLLYFLRKGELSTQEMALKATFRLCDTSEEIKKLMGDLGFMPELIKLLGAKSSETREMAAEALSSLVLIPRNRRKFVHGDGNIGLLLQFLDPEDANSGNRKSLLSALMASTSCTSGRRKIANSRYVKNLEKLAEADVLDAKKIVKRLSTNRFRSLLNGLWHS